MVQVFRAEEQWQVVVLDHQCGVGEEEVGVRLQVDDASVLQKVAVALHEPCGGEPLARVLHLGVAEGEPDFLYLVRGEETVDNLDVSAQEGNVLQTLL